MIWQFLIKNPKSKEPIYPLTVVNDDAEARKNILLKDKLFANAVAHAKASEVDIDVISRVDLNPAGGIVRAVKDLAISDIVIGWNGKPSAVDMFFGTIMSQVLHKCPQSVIVSKILQPINTLRKIVVVVPFNAELETGFSHWLNILNRFTHQLGAKLIFYAIGREGSVLKQTLSIMKPLQRADFKQLPDWESLDTLTNQLSSDDLLFIVSAREHTLSFTKNMERLPRFLSQTFDTVSFVILYPEQALDTEGEGMSQQFTV